MKSEMSKILERVAENTSPAEKRKIVEGCVGTAEWIISRVVAGLTPTQIESVAFRFIGYMREHEQC